MKTIKQVGLFFGILITSIGLGLCQTNLQFTGVSATGEGAIKLTWSSVSNEVYEIDEADALIDPNTGGITWNMLYNDYPSQGTNTFWLDTGNYLSVPSIPHPKDTPMRFYRIVDNGPDDLVSNEPTISIISPANSTTASGLLTVTVTANAGAAQGNIYPKFYVDGQVMRPSQDGSNYVINTCEWENGPHVLFATVDSLTQPDGPSGASGLAGHAVSAFVSVTFSNLISAISFSDEFFQPSLGQTQQVSAVFAANCDWVLTIRDVFSNAVRTVTGSGPALQFKWDGTGDGGTNIPDGIYYFYISAQTNGESSDFVSSVSGGISGGSPPSPDFASTSLGDLDSSELWAVPVGSPDDAMPVPLALYPPGFDTNNLTIFAASTSEILSLRPSFSHVSSLGVRRGGASPDDDGGGSPAAAAQTSPPAPLRPPTPPCKGTVGKFGVAYQMYDANSPSPVYANIILADYAGVTSYVQMEGKSGTTKQPFAPFHNVNLTALNFAIEMQNGCWDMGYFEHDDALQLSALQGGGNPFNGMDLGLLICHGTYGTSSDSTPGHPVKQMYFPITAGGSATYLRMSDLSLGGSSPTNGLKWMALMACNSLYHGNWNSMQGQNIKPYNSNLHMILGTGTEFGADPLIGQYWADYMLGDPSILRPPIKIRDAWYLAAQQAYAIGVQNGVADYPNPTTFAVVADPNCTEDYLQTNSLPSGGSWIYNSKQVYP